MVFVDLVGSTALSERLDPEELRDAVHAYHDACAVAVRDLGGFVAQYLGDGVLAYFGFPAAQEHDALRGVKAALRVLQSLPEVSERLGRLAPALASLRLRARAGVHTGPVVVHAPDPALRREATALGETPNVAARLVAEAEPDTVLVSDATRALLGGAFALEDRGRRLLRGFSQPVRCWRVLHERREAAPAARLTPLVGRDEEIAFLLARWADARNGRGQVVLLRGEAGIGKSRLVRELRARIEPEPHVWVECRGSPFHVHAPFHAVLASLERRLAPHAGVEAAARLERLAEFVEESGLPADETLALLVPLLGLFAPSASAPMSPDARRRRIFEVFVAWLARTSERAPVLLVVEDLHWVDPSTLELFALWIAGARRARVLIVGTHRPGFEPPFEEAASLARLELAPLGAPDVRRMIDSLAGPAGLPDGLVSELVARTDGVPLYAEELTRSLLEDPARGRERAVPVSLHDSLMARLDRLGPAKEVAQVASVLGREFDRELLGAVSELDAAALDLCLERLVGAQLLHFVAGGARFAFKHALVGDAAYRSLLHSRRRDCHARVAVALERRFAEQARSAPEVVARHYEEAGRGECAIAWYRTAGQRAMERSAHAEAIADFERAIALLGDVPDPAERASQELSLNVALGAPLLAARGYGSAEAARCHRRAYELASELEHDPLRYQAVSGLFLFHQARAELEPAAQLAAELLGLGERAGDRVVLQWGHFFSGVPYFYRGEFALALDRFERALELFDRSAPELAAYGLHEHDPGISALCYAAMARFVIGFPDRARACADEAVALGRRRGHPFNVGFALSFAAVVDHLRRDSPAVLERTEESVRLCEEHGFPVYLGLSLMLQGYALSAQGDPKAGLARLERGIAAASTGTRIEGPRALAWLAEVQAAAGFRDRALGALDAAQAIAARTGCTFWDAEIARLRGTLLLAGGEADPTEVERCFDRALATARAQGAGGLELRAASSAAELLLRRGEVARAHERLGPVLARFAEGWATGDLREARSLMARASRHRSESV